MQPFVSSNLSSSYFSLSDREPYLIMNPSNAPNRSNDRDQFPSRRPSQGDRIPTTNGTQASTTFLQYIPGRRTPVPIPIPQQFPLSPAQWDTQVQGRNSSDSEPGSQSSSSGSEVFHMSIPGSSEDLQQQRQRHQLDFDDRLRYDVSAQIRAPNLMIRCPRCRLLVHPAEYANHWRVCRPGNSRRQGDISSFTSSTSTLVDMNGTRHSGGSRYAQAQMTATPGMLPSNGTAGVGNYQYGSASTYGQGGQTPRINGNFALLREERLQRRARSRTISYRGPASHSSSSSSGRRQQNGRSAP